MARSARERRAASSSCLGQTSKSHVILTHIQGVDMRIRGIGVFLAVLIGVSNGHAQSTFGAIVGEVKDPTNAVVGKATVKITNADENITRQVLTASDG